MTNKKKSNQKSKDDDNKFYDAWSDGERHKKSKGTGKNRGSVKQNLKNEVKYFNF